MSQEGQKFDRYAERSTDDKTFRYSALSVIHALGGLVNHRPGLDDWIDNLRTPDQWLDTELAFMAYLNEEPFEPVAHDETPHTIWPRQWLAHFNEWMEQNALGSWQNRGQRGRDHQDQRAAVGKPRLDITMSLDFQYTCDHRVLGPEAEVDYSSYLYEKEAASLELACLHAFGVLIRRVCDCPGLLPGQHLYTRLEGFSPKPHFFVERKNRVVSAMDPIVRPTGGVTNGRSYRKERPRQPAYFGVKHPTLSEEYKTKRGRPRKHESATPTTKTEASPKPKSSPPPPPIPPSARLD